MDTNDDKLLRKEEVFQIVGCAKATRLAYLLPI
jgi:hypothetical protein